jgi:6-phosphofructokinase 1
VILIPEIPYDVDKVAEAILSRSRTGHGFSIVAIAEGALSKEEVAAAEGDKKKDKKKQERKPPARANNEDDELSTGHSLRLARQLEAMTGLESRVTILGYLQRGGIPSAGDRLLATRLGTACANFINQDRYGVMVAARGDGAVAVPLEQVVGRRKTVPLDHDWIETARSVNTCLGD